MIPEASQLLVAAFVAIVVLLAPALPLAVYPGSP
jgi:hypothetical protein